LDYQLETPPNIGINQPWVGPDQLFQPAGSSTRAEIQKVIPSDPKKCLSRKTALKSTGVKPLGKEERAMVIGKTGNP